MVTKIIKFSATWCAPCKTFAKTFGKVKDMDEYKDIQFVELDIENDDEGIDLVEKYKVLSVPTTVIVDENGESIYKVSGNIPLSDFVSIINEAKAKDNKVENKDEK